MWTLRMAGGPRNRLLKWMSNFCCPQRGSTVYWHPNPIHHKERKKATQAHNERIAHISSGHMYLLSRRLCIEPAYSNLSASFHHSNAPTSPLPPVFSRVAVVTRRSLKFALNATPWREKAQDRLFMCIYNISRNYLALHCLMLQPLSNHQSSKPTWEDQLAIEVPFGSLKQPLCARKQVHF